MTAPRWNGDVWFGPEDRPRLDVLKVPTRCVSVVVCASAPVGTEPDYRGPRAVGIQLDEVPGNERPLVILFQSRRALDGFMAALERRNRDAWGPR